MMPRMLDPIAVTIGCIEHRDEDDNIYTSYQIDVEREGAECGTIALDNAEDLYRLRDAIADYITRHDIERPVYDDLPPSLSAPSDDEEEDE